MQGISFGLYIEKKIISAIKLGTPPWKAVGVGVVGGGGGKELSLGKHWRFDCN